MIYLDLEDLLHVAERTIVPVEVLDLGLLAAAAERPRASAFGEDAYPSLLEKVAALTHSLARGHALVDGNERLALTALLAFLGVNGLRLTMSQDAAYEFVVVVATGELDDVAGIAAVLSEQVGPR